MKTTNAELSYFCYQLSIIYQSGLPIADGLYILAEDADNETKRTMTLNIAKSLDEGHSLHQSIQETAYFPSYLCRVIHVGETSGHLPEVLQELSEFYDYQSTIQKKIRTAVSYPLTLLVLMFAVLFLLLYKVLPVFHRLLQSLGGSIPKSTKILLSISNVLQSIVIPLISILFIFGMVTYISFKARIFNKFRLFLLTKCPVVSKYYKQFISIKFVKSLSILLKSGLSLNEAAQQSTEVIDNQVIKAQVAQALTDEMGLDALAATSLFQQSFYKMLHLGMKAGSLDDMMNKYAVNYEREFHRRLNLYIDRVEPVLVGILTFLVGIILIILLVPLINIISSIG